jgi:fission process protein 1
MGQNNGNRSNGQGDNAPRDREGELPPRKPLPKELQETLDNEEKLWDTLYEGKATESTESNVRYAAYATRIRTILLSAQRYVAYTSDIGESFRPVAHPYLVRGAYGISWAYLTGDVAYEGYKAYIRNQHAREAYESQSVGSGDKLASITSAVKNMAPGVAANKSDQGSGQLTQSKPYPAIEDYRAVMAQRAVFQSVASMGLPAFTIHSVVRYSGRALKDVKNQKIRTWGPIGLGLAIVPFLPFIFDEPVEKATEWIFHKGFETIGGPDAVRGRPTLGNQVLRDQESKSGTTKEKEL